MDLVGRRAETSRRDPRLSLLIASVAVVSFVAGLYLCGRPSARSHAAHGNEASPRHRAEAAPPAPTPQAVLLDTEKIQPIPTADPPLPAPPLPARAEPRTPPSPPRIPLVKPNTVRRPAMPEAMRRRLGASEEELRRQLNALPEVHYNAADGIRAELENYPAAVAPLRVDVIDGTTSRAGPRDDEAADLRDGIVWVRPYAKARMLQARIALHQKQLNEEASGDGLPMRWGAISCLSTEAARFTNAFSRALRQRLGHPVVGTPLGVVGGGKNGVRELLEYVRGQDAFQHEGCDVAPVLEQVLQIEGTPDRRLLLEELARLKRPSASAALARRAVFDLSAEIRRAAVEALKKRPIEEYESILLDALSYPWPPAADHAALALVELNDTRAVPELLSLLSQPDPARPYYNRRRQRYELREVVRINHLNNCCLCHAPSFDQGDPVRGQVPIPGRRLSVAYYQGFDGAFVRADIIYLRQDFSAVQPMLEQTPWPDHQRYDYVVRTIIQPPTVGQQRSNKAAQSCPQREAVRFALQELNGKEADPYPSQADELGEGGTTPSRP